MQALFLTAIMRQGFWQPPSGLNDADPGIPYLPLFSPAAAVIITAEAGAYTISGQSVGLEYGRELLAGSGAYLISGTAASLEQGHELNAESGAYVITGQDVTLTYGSLAVASNIYPFPYRRRRR